MANRDELIMQMAQIQQDFARFVRNVEQDDLPVAVSYARQMADRLRSLVNEIQKSLAEDFFKHRARTFESDMTLLSKFEAKLPSRSDQAEIAQVVAHFSNSIRSLDHLVKLMYPDEPYSFAPVVRRYWRHAAIAVGAIVVLCTVFATYSHVRTLREGLVGEYFASRKLENLQHRRIDPQVNFKWGKHGPFRHWRSDDFSARWTGYLYIPHSDHWTLYTVNDDGARLYLGKKQLIDDWTIHGASENHATVDLEKGYYPITIEYFEARSGAVMQLYWKIPDEKKAHIIPAANLIPSAKYLDKDIPLIEDLDHPGTKTSASQIKTDEDNSDPDGPDGEESDDDSDDPPSVKNARH